MSGYNGNIKLKKPDTLVEWTPEMLREMAKCRNDPIYFAKNYIKIVHVDRGVIPFDMYPYQEEIVEKITNHRRVAVLTARQSGKALSLDTPIPTPEGWTTMGDLKKGDTIFDARGNPTVVNFITETMHDHTVFDVCFDNGEVVKADAEHLWTVEVNLGATFVAVTKNTSELKSILDHAKSEGRTVRIKSHNGVDYKKSVLPIDPYKFGANICDELYLNENNFAKQIPIAYKQSSRSQRMELIRGIMDAHGNIDPKTGKCSLYEDSEDLINDMREVLASLGIKTYPEEKPLDVKCHGLSFATKKFMVFKDHSKTEIQSKAVINQKDEYFYIKSIEKTISVPVRCIQVENDEHLFLCSKSFIPTHNTTTAVAVILHYIIFSMEPKSVAILANKGDAAKEVLSRIKLAYEELPQWMQQGVLEWNKHNIELENGCKVLAGTTSSSAIRGKSINFLYIDESAFIDGYEEFFSSVYPTISSGESTKLLMTSTPNGLNHFWQTCEGARLGTNGYQYVEVQWYDVPGRGDEWKRETLEALNFDMEKFEQEYCCAFLGSSGTLISGSKLKLLDTAVKQPLAISENIRQYVRPDANRSYAMICDVSRGKGLDYSTFSIIDVTEMPYQQVCTYRDNEVGPVDFASIIFRMATLYCEASVLIEINDIGGQVADVLFLDYGYENMMFTENAGRSGKRISGGYGKNIDRGIRTTKTVKSIGCSILKLMIEQDQLFLYDKDTVEEIKRFSKKANSYEAESGWHDDMVMTLVLFSWFSDQVFFKDLTDINTLMALREKTDEQMDNYVLPFGFVVRGEDDDSPQAQQTAWNTW